MYDALLMRELHRFADFDEKLQPLSHGKSFLAHIVGNRNAIDVFHHKVGQAVVGCSSVEQTRDVRMVEAGKNPTLSVEAAQNFIRIGAAFQQLDRTYFL